MFSAFFISVLLSFGVATFVYLKLVKANGNPTPGQDLGAAAVAGVVAFVVIFTFLKFILQLD